MKKPNNILHFRPNININVSQVADDLNISQNELCRLALADYVQKLRRMGMVA